MTKKSYYEENRESCIETVRRYNLTPGGKAKRRLRRQTPRYRALRKAQRERYYKRHPDAKTRKNRRAYARYQQWVIKARAAILVLEGLNQKWNGKIWRAK